MPYTVKVVKVVEKSNFGAKVGNNAKEIKEVKTKISKPVIQVAAWTTRAGYKHEHRVIEVNGTVTHAFLKQNKVYLVTEEMNDGTGSHRVQFSK